MDKTKLVSVAFCCNDPDNGMDTGRFDAVNIGDQVIELRSLYWGWRGLRLRQFTSQEDCRGFGAAKATGYIKVASLAFAIHGYKYGWGNWCWDLYLMTAEDTVDLLNHLKSFKRFHCEDTPDEMAEIWDAEDRTFSKDPGSIEMKLLTEEGYARP